MHLAEDSLDETPVKVWLQRVVIALVLIGVVWGLTVLVRKLSAGSHAPARQTAKISILPDAPPPPPPKEEPKKEPPKEEPKQVMPEQQPKPQDAPPPPANDPIKMEGAAGDGPSAFQSGSVGKDYAGGAPVVGASSPVAPTVDRAQERFYANAARQQLRDEIERHLRPEAGELTATFAIWVEADGRIQRYAVSPSGDTTRDTDMEHALGGAQRVLRLAPPAGLAQPMRFRLTVRPQG